MSISLAFDRSCTARGLEFVSLASIFPDEFQTLDELPLEVCQKGGWQNGMIPEARCFRLRVKAEIVLEKNHVEVDLICGVGPGYPSSSSSVLIHVDNVLGLSEQLVQKLTVELRELATHFKSQEREMMYDLYQHAQEFLRQHNVDPKKSFYDQMMEQERLQTEVKKQEAVAIQASQQEVMQQKKERKQQIQNQAKEEQKRRKQIFRGSKQRSTTVVRDLWGSDSDPSSCDEEMGEEDDTVPDIVPFNSAHRHGTDAPAARHEDFPRSTATPDTQAASAAGRPSALDPWKSRAPADGRSDPPVEPACSAAAVGTDEAAWGGTQIRWKKFMSMKAVGDGEVALVPDILGIGRFGVVYMAMVESNPAGGEPRPGAVIAIKELALDEDNQPRKQTQLARALAEIECQRQMVHENIVQVFGAAVEDGVFRILMEYLPMGSVASLLRLSGQLEEEVVRIFTQQLIRGVDFLHSRRVVHRDIKPGNLLLHSNGVLKLGDFGEAHWMPDLLERSLLLRSIKGTTRYMAPEVIRQEYTAAADIWSIGCTVLEMLTGQVPFSSFSNDMAVMRNVLRLPNGPAIPSGLSDDCASFLRACFAPDAATRPTAAELRCHPFIAGTSVCVSPTLAQGSGGMLPRVAVTWHPSPTSPTTRPTIIQPASPSQAAGNKVSSWVGGTGKRGTSRYAQDFVELEKLGEGGFGEVWKCRNRLDGQLYAIKKIRLQSDSEEANKKMLREVKTLSGLHHQNVVRYFQAWIEGGAEADESEEENSDSTFSEGSDLVEDSIFDAAYVRQLNKQRPATNRQTALSSEAAKNARNSQLPKQLPSPVAEDVGFGQVVADNDATTSSSWMEASGEDGGEVPSEGDAGEVGCNQIRVSNLMSRFEGLIRSDDNHTTADELISMPRQVMQASPGPSTNAGGLSPAMLPITLGPPAPSGGHRVGRQHEPASSSSEEVGVKGGDGRVKSKVKANKEVQVLYIQMEYCEKTLADVITENKLHKTPDRLWNLFRQLVTGLAYIHSKGIVHRDLKPKNIFLDFSGDIKIGDLGLARFSKRHDDDDDGEGGKMRSHEPEESSGGVGTMLYMSPEILSGRCSEDYDQSKRDIYALGVILFEMWWPFRTGTERIIALQDLRLQRLPPAMVEATGANRPQVCQLIRWLISELANQRPTALEMLDSELLPTSMMESDLQQVLRNVQQKPSFHSLLMRALFSRDDSGTDFLYSADAHAHDVFGSQFLCRRLPLFSSIFTRVAIRHGGQLLRVPLLMPKNKVTAHTRQVLVMDPAGAQLGLPYDLTVPFAHLLARKSLQQAFRRYSIGTVYRAKHGKPPREAAEASFDIASSHRSGPEQRRLDDAEIIRVVFELLMEAPVDSPAQYALFISYSGILESLLGLTQVPRAQHGSVVAALGQTSRLGWPAAKRELSQVAKKDPSVKRLLDAVSRVLDAADAGQGFGGQLLLLQGSLQSLGMQGTPLYGAAASAVADLAAVWSWAQFITASLDYRRIQVILDPGLAIDKYNGGLVFQVVIRSAKAESAVIASGGRFDPLIKNLWKEVPNWSTAPVGAVGVCVSLERLARDVRVASSSMFEDGRAESGCGGIMIHSRGGGELALEERLRVMGEVWSQGWPAYTLPVDAVLEQVQAHCASRHVDWILVLPDTSRDGTTNPRPELRVGEGRVKLLRSRSIHDRSKPGQAAGSTTTHERAKTDIFAPSVSEALETLSFTYPPTVPSSQPTPSIGRSVSRRGLERTPGAAVESGAAESRGLRDRDRDWERSAEDWSEADRAGRGLANFPHGSTAGGAALSNLSLHFTERKLKQPQSRTLAATVQRKVWPAIRAMGLNAVEVVVCSQVTSGILQEIVEAAQKGKLLDSIRAAQKKHRRHEDELVALEELVMPLRTSGLVVLFSGRDEFYALLPLPPTT